MGWTAHFDNSDWEIANSLGSWDAANQEWDSERYTVPPTDEHGLHLAELGSWVADYRPTKVRVTYTGGSTMTLYIDGSILDSNYASLEEIDISLSSDISTLWLHADDVTAFSVTNIEFYEEGGETIWDHKFNGISNFSKINGISNFSKINGVE